MNMSEDNPLEHILTLNKIRYALMNKILKYSFCYDINFGVDTLNYLIFKVRKDSFITFTIKPLYDSIPKHIDCKTKYLNINGNIENIFLPKSLIICMNTFNSVYVNADFIKKLFQVVRDKKINLIGCIYDTDYIDELLNDKAVYYSTNIKLYKKTPIFKISFPSNLCVGSLVENYAKLLSKKELKSIVQSLNLHINFFSPEELIDCEKTPQLKVRTYFCVSSETLNNS